MSSNGAFAKANEILHVNDAVEAAAMAAAEAKHLVWYVKDMERGVPRGNLIDDAANYAKIAAGLSAYVLMLSEVRP